MLRALVIFACLFIIGCAERAAETPEQTAEGIRAVVKDHSPEIQGCYRQYLTQNPKWQGRIVMEWKIDDNGKTVDLKPHSSKPQADELSNCLVQKIQSWKFSPAPKQSFANVKYPFVFAQDAKQ